MINQDWDGTCPENNMSWQKVLARLESSAVNLPKETANDIALVSSFVSKIFSLKTSHVRVWRAFLRAMKFTPSSERVTDKDRPESSKNIDEKEKKESKGKAVDVASNLLRSEENSVRMADWHKKHAKRHTQDAKNSRLKRETLMKKDDEELTPEEQAELLADQAASKVRARLGNGADPALAPHAETLMHGASTNLRRSNIDLNVDVDTLPKGAIINQKFSEIRDRIDFQMSLTSLSVKVEKLAITTLREKTLVAADMQEIGPPKMRVTWGFLVNMTLLISQYVMPFNRFAKITSCVEKKFTGGEISRYFLFVAEHFVALYTHLGQSLAQAPILAGDDTPSLVLEVNAAQKRSLLGEKSPMPWATYADVATSNASYAAGDRSLGVQLGRVFGYQSQRKNGSGAKIAFNTTTISGRTEPNNPQSTVIFYRSHLGGFGNLLDAILPRRHDESGKIVIQSDLSTVNLVSDPDVKSRFAVDLAGCSSHARRPFFLHRQDDPEACGDILRAFSAIPLHENIATLCGRNDMNVRAVRDVDERKYWVLIRDLCTEMLERWSSKTPLGEAARYVLRHYDKLTYYLDHPRVAPHNNFAERMLRLEKLIANNSMFRQSLNGRFALDIMRTVLQTCIAAEVDAAHYLVWILRFPKEVVTEKPEAYTPLSFKQWCRDTDDKDSDWDYAFSPSTAFASPVVRPAAAES